MKCGVHVCRMVLLEQQRGESRREQLLEQWGDVSCADPSIASKRLLRWKLLVCGATLPRVARMAIHRPWLHEKVAQ